MAREPYSARFCIHYAGSGQTCHAGVDVATMRDSEERVPCAVIRGLTGTKPCEHRDVPEPPAPQQPGSLTTRLNALLLGLCPTCEEPVRGEAEIDGNVYAMPCEHVLRSAKDSPT